MLGGGGEVGYVFLGLHRRTNYPNLRQSAKIACHRKSRITSVTQGRCVLTTAEEKKLLSTFRQNRNRNDWLHLQSFPSILLPLPHFTFSKFLFKRCCCCCCAPQGLRHSGHSLLSICDNARGEARWSSG